MYTTLLESNWKAAPWTNPMLIVACLLAPLVLISQAPDIDLYIADTLYQLEGGGWSLKHSWLTETVIHRGGRQLTGLIALLVLVSIVTCSYVPAYQKYQFDLIYVLASALISGIVISLLKEASQANCPWDLARYGGDQAFLLTQDGGRCFPAGHASAGYGWFGFFYFATTHFPHYRLSVLFAVIALGAIFGIAQQFRGAHFLSHDLTTMWICWAVATATYYLMPAIFRRSQ